MLGKKTEEYKYGKFYLLELKEGTTFGECVKDIEAMIKKAEKTEDKKLLIDVSRTSNINGDLQAVATAYITAKKRNVELALLDPEQKLSLDLLGTDMYKLIPVHQTLQQYHAKHYGTIN